MAHPQFYRDRQGRQFRTCADCNGAGWFTVGVPSGDPQQETEERCHDCGGTGNFRVTRMDPLELVSRARREIGKGQYYRALYWRYRQQQMDIKPRLPRYVPSASTEFMGALAALTGFRVAA